MKKGSTVYTLYILYAQSRLDRVYQSYGPGRVGQIDANICWPSIPIIGWCSNCIALIIFYIFDIPFPSCYSSNFFLQKEVTLTLEEGKIKRKETGTFSSLANS